MLLDSQALGRVRDERFANARGFAKPASQARDLPVDQVHHLLPRPLTVAEADEDDGGGQAALHVAMENLRDVPVEALRFVQDLLLAGRLAPQRCIGLVEVVMGRYAKPVGYDEAQSGKGEAVEPAKQHQPRRVDHRVVVTEDLDAHSEGQGSAYGDEHPLRHNANSPRKRWTRRW